MSEGTEKAAYTQGLMDGAVATIAMMSKRRDELAAIAQSLPLPDPEKLELQMDMSNVQSREDKIKLIIRCVAENDCFAELLSAIGKAQGKGNDGFSR